MAYKAAKGTYDILPKDIDKWHFVEDVCKKICTSFNYQEIRTPIFESTNLFIRSVGETTDIVSKEMYTFDDKKGRSITLRPEGTAGVVRSYVEHKMFADSNQPTKLFYFGPIFRYERMQKGRQRQFTQFGIEALGSKDPAVDVEVISLVVEILQSLGLKKVKVALNTLGDSESRLKYREALVNHFKPVICDLCGDCKARLEKNPLRILDCKVDREHPAMKTAPKLMDYLNEESRKHFEKVKQYLTDLNIDFVIDNQLVRGLDYYNHTVFEVMSEVEGFGALTTLCGGGRYNGLVQEIGGPETPAVGVAFGVERLILALEAEGVNIPSNNKIDAYIVSLGEKANDFSVKLVNDLRRENLQVEKDYLNRKFKAQLKSADRLNARLAVIIGDDELEKDICIIKNLDTGIQEEVALDKVINYIKNK